MNSIFFIRCGALFLIRLPQGKFEIERSWEWKVAHPVFLFLEPRHAPRQSGVRLPSHVPGSLARAPTLTRPSEQTSGLGAVKAPECQSATWYTQISPRANHRQNYFSTSTSLPIWDSNARPGMTDESSTTWSHYILPELGARKGKYFFYCLPSGRFQSVIFALLQSSTTSRCRDSLIELLTKPLICSIIVNVVFV